jgi:ubiquitin carboxyl-terminal hydrolase 5/13
MSKLAILEERDEDKYEHVTVVKCWTCDVEKGREIPDAVSDSKARRTIRSITEYADRIHR